MPPPEQPSGRPAEVRILAEQLPRMMRVLHGLKSQLSTHPARDRAALVLLFPLARLGPLRQSVLADLVHADPSTISRHVAALVEQGLAQRVSDESDGRASRLVVTDAGHAALETLRRERESHLARVTTGWSDSDLTTLTTLFGRLLDDLAATPPGPGDVAAPLTRTPASPKDDA